VLVISTIVFLQIGLLIIASLSNWKRRQLDGGDQEDRALAIRFARGLTVASCAMGAVVALITLRLPRDGSLLLKVNLLCLILGPLASAAGLTLFIAKGRGLERVLGSLSALLGLGYLLFIMYAEVIGV
jgi:hypothetical protein